MKQPLNFNWHYASNWKDEYLKEFKDYQLVDIPHNTHLLKSHYIDETIYQHLSTYEKYFDILPDFNNKHVFLCFEGFMVQANIFLNNIDLGNYISTYLPVRIDITKYVKEKDNRLLLKLDSREDDNIPPFGNAIDYLTFGGIYREVYLEIKENIHITNLFVHADDKGNVDIECKTNSDGSSEFLFEIIDNNKVIAQSKNAKFKVDNITLWDLDNPRLYLLKATLLKNKEIVGYSLVRFGFRTAIFTNNGFYLNGKKIKLLGVNRHQSYPYIGYAATKRLEEEDACLLKTKLGINLVRTSHYIDSEHFLNKCDEIGLLVIDEVPGWQYISAKETWRNNFYDFIKRMCIHSYNHPSIIAHGVRIDESQDDHELYKIANAIAHSIDKYRQTLGVRNFKNSELLEDIYAYNDFSCCSLKHGLDNPITIKHQNKPYIVTECMGHMFPTKSFDNESRRIEHALRHFKVIDDYYKYNKIAALTSWCFVDYYTHKDFGSGDNICYHGVFDMYRTPKYASFAYSSQQDKFPVFEVLNSLQSGDFDEALCGKIVVATNADYLDVYKNDDFVARFYPNKKLFPHLPHPPIIIDDLVGDSFKDDRFTNKDARKIAKLLGYVSTNGFNKLSVFKYVKLGILMLKYHLKYKDIVELWNKHISNWGAKTNKFTFKGYKNNNLIASKTLSALKSKILDVSINTTKLMNKDTYDTASLTIKSLDQNGRVLNYDDAIITVSSSGPLQIIGPSIFSLVGGVKTLYVRSLNTKGKGTIKVMGLNETITIDIEVE